MTDEALRRRLELRRSNAAVPHRMKTPDEVDWLAEWEAEFEAWEPGELQRMRHEGY